MSSIIITGSTRGVGFCMAKEFLKAGHNVTISGRNEKSFDNLKKELVEYKNKVLYAACDVTNKSELENLWKESSEKWGKIDFWINNAGQNCPHEYIYDTEQSYVDSVINTNIRGMIYGSQIAAKNMLLQGGGQIWNMEGLGSNDMIQVKTVLYGMTKHALTYFTKGLAKELEGKSVLIGRLSPGMMLTDFITKTPDGDKSPVIEDEKFIKLFNILADKPDTVAAYFIPRMLNNTKNNAHIEWLTNTKAMMRFTSALFKKRKLI
jgi:short-subunit dehydrogenase